MTRPFTVVDAITWTWPALVPDERVTVARPLLSVVLSAGARDSPPPGCPPNSNRMRAELSSTTGRPTESATMNTRLATSVDPLSRTPTVVADWSSSRMLHARPETGSSGTSCEIRRVGTWMIRDARARTSTEFDVKPSAEPTTSRSMVESISTSNSYRPSSSDVKRRSIGSTRTKAPGTGLFVTSFRTWPWSVTMPLVSSSDDRSHPAQARARNGTSRSRIRRCMAGSRAIRCRSSIVVPLGLLKRQAAIGARSFVLSPPHPARL